MSDSQIYVRDVKTGELIPLKLIDNGDGTYSLPGIPESAVLQFTASSATVTSITCAALADVASEYVGQMALPLNGPMEGEGRYIIAYNGTNTITISPAWPTDPDVGGTITLRFAIVSGALGILPLMLGTNGTAVTDSATSVLGAIGANNNDNAFDS